MRRLATRLLRWTIMAALLGGCGSIGVSALVGADTWQREPLWGRVVFALAMLIVPMLYFWRPRQYGERMHAAFEELADDTGGRVTWNGVLDPDFDLHWSRGGVRAHLHAWIDDFTTEGKNRNPPPSARYRFRYTLDVPPQSGTLRLEVFPETVLEAAAKMFGMQDLSLNDSSLDPQLVVQASDRAEYTRCLERGLASQLRDLLQLSNDRSVIHVSYVPGRLVVQRSRRIQWEHANEERAVRELHDTALKLLYAITGLRAEKLMKTEPAIAEVTVVAAPPEGAVCLVCGSAVGEAPVVCARCDTPHHRDCWDYNGACALYACGSKDARRVAARAATVT